jgi:hypothetical protein
MHSLGMQSDEVRTELATFVALAGFDTEQIRIGAVRAFAQRYADFGNGDMAGSADSEKILTLPIVFAARQILVVFKKAENSTTHKNMGMGAMIRLDLFQAFIDPIDAIPTINHNRRKYFNALEMGALLRFRGERLV